MRTDLLAACATLGLQGCAGQVPLSEVPIHGGDPPQQQTVRDALVAFDRAVGEGRLRLPSVRIREWSRVGSVNQRSLRITLDASLFGDDLAFVARHELGHALDFAEALLERPDPLFDDLADELVEADLIESVDDYPTARLRRSEMFAVAVALGPLPTQLAATACPGDDPRGTELGEWMAQRVWGGERVGEAQLGDEARWNGLHYLPDRLAVEPTIDPEVIDVWPIDELPGDGLSDQRAAVSWRTGVPVDPAPEGDTEPRGGPAVTDLWVRTRAGWDGGPAGLTVELPTVPMVERPALRWLHSDGTTWATVEGGCPEGPADWFTADGAVWLAVAGADHVRWARVE